MIVITGASDGLGLHLAKLYQQAGIRVVNLSRRPCQYATDNVLVDLAVPEEITAAARSICAIPEPLSALINCAGVMSIEPLSAMTAKELERVFAVNVKAPMLLVSELCERVKHDRSDIVNVASTVGLRGVIDQTAYSTSKWALRGFSHNLQLELRDTNRVISFCIGGFNSTVAEKVTGQSIADPDQWMDPDAIAGFLKQILALPKIMEVSEIVIHRKPALREVE